MRGWKRVVAMVGFAAAALAPDAFAGRDLTPDGAVEIIPLPGGGGYAIGSLSATRNVGNASSYIGCFVAAVDSGQAEGGCMADDGVNPAVSCNFAPLDFVPYIEATRNLTPSSWLFLAWDGSGICTFMLVDEDSSYAPAEPAP